MVSGQNSVKSFGYLKIPVPQSHQIILQQMPNGSQCDSGVSLKEQVLLNSARQMLHKTGIYKISKNDMIKIGRDSSSNNFVLASPYISMNHCSIWVTQFEESSRPLFYLKDTSLNGVYVNGKKIGKNQIIILSHNDEIEIKFAFTAIFKYRPKYEKDEKVLHDHESEDSSLCQYEQVSLNWFITKRILGNGTFGSVYVAENIEKISTRPYMLSSSKKSLAIKHKRNSICAVKIIKTLNYSSQIREAEILVTLNHPHIVQVYETICDNDKIYIFEELICGGDLFSYLAKTDYLVSVPEPEAILIIYQILQAVKYLHDNGIVHRDLKLDNILLESPEPLTRIVIADFGTACKQEAPAKGKRMKTVVGTPEYTAPEVGFAKEMLMKEVKSGKQSSLKRLVLANKDHNVSNIKSSYANKNSSSIFDLKKNEGPQEVESIGYTKKCDMWSVGVIMHIVLSGISPFFEDGDEMNIIAAAGLCNLDFSKKQWSKVSLEAKDLIVNLLNLDEQERFSAQDCLDHKWISEYWDVLKDVYETRILKKA